MDQNKTASIHEPFPEISAAIASEKFVGARALIENYLEEEHTTDEIKWLKYQLLVCILGCAAQEVWEGKDAMHTHNHPQALIILEKAANTMESHLGDYGLRPAIIHPMIEDMKNIMKNCCFRDLPQRQKERDEMLKAIRETMQDNLSQRFLIILLDTHFYIKVAQMHRYAHIVGQELSYIQSLLEKADFEIALAKIEIERAKREKDAISQEHLDHAEHAVRSILVYNAYQTADDHFKNKDIDKGLLLYEKIMALMEGQLGLFQVNEPELKNISYNFERRVISSHTKSYKDTLAFRASYAEALKEYFGSNPDAQVISMTLDAYITLKFYNKPRSNLFS